MAIKTKAVRMYGKCDLRLEEFELPEISDSEILAHVVSDSLCMSSYKASKQGADHKRVPNNIDKEPVIIGHEFCGEIVKVGKKWQDKFHEGQKFTIQPATNYKGTLDAPGYSYKYCGGDSTYVIIPEAVMIMDCLLPYNGDAFFYGSLSEPMSCIVGGFHASYHTTAGKYVHDMGITKDGLCAILAGVGPMGLGAIDYALNCDRRPKKLVVTDIDDVRLKRAESFYSKEYAKERGVELIYLNTATGDAVENLLSLTDGKGYNDVFVFAPVKSVVETGDKILGKDGCLNFFAGPTDAQFSAEFNFYNVHYASTHIVGTTGGNTDDMRESIAMMEKGLINPAAMITHVGGLDSVVETTLNLPNIRGGKKLVYTNISMPMTAIADFEELGKNDPVFAQLAKLTAANNGLWSKEAEDYLLSHSKAI